MSVKMIQEDRHMISQMMTTDTQTGTPALTTLLHKVCNGNQTKFEEACRLLNLFMDKAQERK